jgi:hypothetical protein
VADAMAIRGGKQCHRSYGGAPGCVSRREFAFVAVLYQPNSIGGDYDAFWRPANRFENPVADDVVNCRVYEFPIYRRQSFHGGTLHSGPPPGRSSQLDSSLTGDPPQRGRPQRRPVCMPPIQKQLRVDPGTEDLLRALLTSPMMSLPVSKGAGSGELTVITTGTSHLSTPA